MNPLFRLRPLLFSSALILLPAGSALRADAPAAWSAQCASCHGKDGTGHTRAGRLVGTKDMTKADYQKSFTDEQAFNDIKNGLQKDGKTKMKPFAAKLSDADIKALVAYVRTLAQ